MTDFRRRKWRAYGTDNSVPKKQMVPRVSMIAGLDNRGKVYLSLLQSNTNASIMGIFFRSLVRTLEKEDKFWYLSTVCMMDNAPYHVSESTMKVLEELRIPVLFTGPHSYSASPIELFFGAFKADDINPQKVQTGRR